jgi:hypothetical protein
MDQKKPLRTLFLVIICSIWAGVCRINWYFVPAGLSVFLYLLEVPLPNKNYFKYLIWPAIWFVIGIGFAFMASNMYSILSGNPPDLFGTAIRSPLLWYRLFPNSTYGLGILLSTILIFFPLFLIVDPKTIWERLTPFRSGLIAMILTIFFSGGLIVSMKIGGGSNYHNFDAFIVFSLIYITSGYFASPPFQEESFQTNYPGRLSRFGFLFSCVIIVAIVSLPASTPKQFQQKEIQKEIVKLKMLSLEFEGNILFLSERQLIATGDLNPVGFEKNYDQVTLMEMVDSNNASYLKQFYSEIKQHKFSMIITKPLNSKLQDRHYKFSRENNLWVKKVEIPVLKSYELIAELPLSQIEIYIPK